MSDREIALSSHRNQGPFFPWIPVFYSRLFSVLYHHHRQAVVVVALSFFPTTIETEIQVTPFLVFCSRRENSQSFITQSLSTDPQRLQLRHVRWIHQEQSQVRHQTRNSLLSMVSSRYTQNNLISVPRTGKPMGKPTSSRAFVFTPLF